MDAATEPLATKSAVGRLKQKINSVKTTIENMWRKSGSDIYLLGGNVGIGTNNPKTSLQIGNATHLFEIGDDTFITYNSYFNGANWIYTTDNSISLTVLGNDGSYNYLTAPPGSAGASATLTGRFHISKTGSIGIGTSAPVASGICEISSTTRGFLPPRMTHAQKQAIASPAEGLMVYDTTLGKLSVWTDPTWEGVSSA